MFDLRKGTDTMGNVKNTLPTNSLSIVQNLTEDIDLPKARDKEYEQQLEDKVKAGKKLTAKEMNYLKTYNPYLYRLYQIVQSKIKSVETRLKGCKTKEEAQKIQDQEILSIGKANPYRTILVDIVNRVMSDFKKTKEYQQLPSTEKEAEKNKKETPTLKYEFPTGKHQYQEVFLNKSEKIPESMDEIS